MDVQLNSPSDYIRFEKIVSQFLLKALHLILESRIPSFKPRDHSGELLSDSKVKNSDKWFNLVLGDRPATLEKLQFWHRNLMDPMVIDIIVVTRGLQGSYGNEREVVQGTAVETVIERWVVQYESHRTMPVPHGDNSLLYKKMYQKSIVLFRCLCSTMRLLPAYKIFKHLRSSSQACNIDIIYKVSTFGHPFSREEEKSMKQYSFNPVDSVNSRLCVSVSYRANLSDFDIENSTSFPAVIIPDYVGSPATDPMRAFPTIDRVPRATSFSLRGKRPPSSMPSERPHSWSTGIHAPAFTQNNPFTGSPPLFHSPYMPNDDPSFPTSSQGQRVHNYGIPQGHHKASSYDESLSPPFSPASSPSPPTHLFGHSPSQSRFRPESAPVAIPRAMLNRSPIYLSPNLSDPSRHSLPPLSPRSSRRESLPLGSPSPSGSRISQKLEALRPGESYSEGNQSFGSKVFKDGKDESGRFSGLLSSGSSPHRVFSGSSSRRSFQDDLDGGAFILPFDVDDVDTSDSQASQGLDGRKGGESNSAFSLGRTSQDAAVGALVHMLRTAPPLRQDSSFYSTNSQITQQEGNFGTTASGFFMPRKAADALEELKSYRDMKDLLLSKSGNRVVSREGPQALPLNIKGRKI